MNNILQVTDVVRDILRDDVVARDSDDYLYTKVVERFNPEALTMPFGEVMLARRILKVPCFESVRRSRQKLQADEPHLCGSKAATADRKQKEDMMREYAKKHI
jgi:hypothetical protein